MEQALDNESHMEATACSVDEETKQWVTGADHGSLGLCRGKGGHFCTGREPLVTVVHRERRKEK